MPGRWCRGTVTVVVTDKSGGSGAALRGLIIHGSRRGYGYVQIRNLSCAVNKTVANLVAMIMGLPDCAARSKIG